MSMRARTGRSGRARRSARPPRTFDAPWWTVSARDLGRSRSAASRQVEHPVGLRRGRGDLVLLVVVGVLVALGIVMVFDVTYFYGQEKYGDPLRFFRRHVLAVGAGAVAFALAASLPLPAYRRLALPGLAAALAGIALVLSPLGVAYGGAQRWLHLAGVSVQPSELAKFALVLYLAWTLARRREQLDDFRAAVTPPLVVVCAMAILLLLEPDFGTAVLLGGVFVAMLFVAGVPMRYLAMLHVIALPAALLVALTADYRKVRIMSFLDPWGDPRNSGFQLIQSLIGFGSGGLGGLGLGESRQKMFYLPAAHTDFVFSVIGEELGLIGALVVLLLFAVLGARGARIAQRHADPFGRLLAFGLTALVTLQAVVNMAVVLGLLPTKGLPLPLVSYGGSAMVMALASVGALYSLSRETG